MIHPTAIIDPTAELAEDIEVGPYAVIEEGVEIAGGCRVHAHAQVLRGTKMGEKNTVGHGAVLGADPQDLSFDPACRSSLLIGDGNTIREHVTLHRSAKEGGATRLGDGNLLMVGAHLGHDGAIGDHCVLANNCLIGGHTTVGDRCFLGGGAAFHQFLRVGECAMAQGNGVYSQDIPPFTTVALRNRLVGLNAVGLKRAGVSPAERRELKQLFLQLFRGGGRLSEALAVASGQQWGATAGKLLAFMAGGSVKGVCSVEK